MIFLRKAWATHLLDSTPADIPRAHQAVMKMKTCNSPKPFSQPILSHTLTILSYLSTCRSIFLHAPSTSAGHSGYLSDIQRNLWIKGSTSSPLCPGIAKLCFVRYDAWSVAVCSYFFLSLWTVRLRGRTVSCESLNLQRPPQFLTYKFNTFWIKIILMTWGDFLKVAI